MDDCAGPEAAQGASRRLLADQQISAAGRAGQPLGAVAGVPARIKSNRGAASLHLDLDGRVGRYASPAARRMLAQLLHRRADAERGDARGVVCVISSCPLGQGTRMIFSVWAPFAKSVELVAGDRRGGLAQKSGGGLEGGWGRRASAGER